jgi:DNA-binding transcriptional LysR family regulator
MKWEFERDGVRIDVAETGPLLTNDADLQLAAALDGLGLACLTESAVRQHVQAGRLVQVLDEWCKPFPGWHLYYPKTRLMPKKLRALVDFLKDSPR